MTQAIANRSVFVPSSPMRLSRNEATQKLHTLVPGTEDYSRLQDALIKGNGLVDVYLKPYVYKIDSTKREEALPGGFGSCEHVSIGEKIELQGGINSKETSLIEGLAVPFSYIVALAGDYYGIPGKAISLPGGQPEEKRQRFINAFNTMFEGDRGEVTGIVSQIREEYNLVSASACPSHCYSQQMMERNYAIKQITKHCDIDELLIDNSDHFSENAIDSYLIGHAEAIRLAQEAGRSKSQEELKKAYAVDAFACHFLTDLFSAGHIRNQRGALEDILCKKFAMGSKQAKTLAGLLTAAQHEVDGAQGLIVKSRDGKSWTAYGDSHYFSSKNKKNKKRAIEAVQKSVNEVYAAYKNPEALVDTTAMSAVIPVALPEKNPPPIYSIVGDQLFYDEKEIEDSVDFSARLIAHALNYLPQSHVENVISAYLPKADSNDLFSKALAKIAIPFIGRLTGGIWSMLGVASHSEIQQRSQDVKAELAELGELVQANSQSCGKIFEELKAFKEFYKQNKELSEIEKQLTSLKATINGLQGLYKEGARQVIQSYLKDKQNDLLERLMNISYQIKEKGLLKLYDEMKQNTVPDPDERKMIVTRWFREFLDIELQTMSLITFAMQLNATSNSSIQEDIKAFVKVQENNIRDQILINKKWIDLTIISYSLTYIDLQIEKTKIKKRASKQIEEVLSEGNSIILQRGSSSSSSFSKLEKPH